MRNFVSDEITAPEGGSGMNEQTGVALVSAPPDKAEAIARRLVVERLAACAQVSGPLTSIYQWQEKLEEEQERLIVLKTSAGKLAAIRELLGQVHPYELPELIFLPAGGGDPAYLRWIIDTLGAPG
jgi:periplasmic divalent cation tolerance protein